jgi:EAL domain-containing protein (putative c-di-GMP-specific phosphodiesterase class I)
MPQNEPALRAALASDQFLLVYQPKFRLAASMIDRSNAVMPGAMIAVEALVRWRTPAGLLLIPHQFVPLAEASGMIRPLGDWVLRTALSEVSRFATHPAAHGRARVGVTINVSLIQLHDRSFVRTVEAALREVGMAAHELTVEIAETAFLEDIRLVADALAELSAMGVRLAIDHFGVGTAGLVALKALPIDEIKIDRSFIAGAATDAFDATIVSSLIAMAHDLGKTVTAEGVERADQLTSLSQMRCDAIQGYFAGEPMTAADLVARASLWQKTPGSER